MDAISFFLSYLSSARDSQKAHREHRQGSDGRDGCLETNEICYLVCSVLDVR